MIEIKLAFYCDNCLRKSGDFIIEKTASRRWAREAVRLQGWTSHKPIGKGKKLIDLCPECKGNT
jgi:hypothetical protein